MLGDLWDRLRDLVSDGLAGLGVLLLCAVPFVLLFALVGLVARCTG